MLYANQKGVAIVVVLLALTTLTIAGLTAIKTTLTDTQISGNLKDIKQAFFISNKCYVDPIIRCDIQFEVSFGEAIEYYCL